MKILIVTKNWLGDILFEFPSIEAIKANYPVSEVVCVAPERCKDLLLSNPAVNRVILFDEKSTHRNWIRRAQFVSTLKAEKFDQVYFFHRSRTRSFIGWLAGIPKRVGYLRRGRKLFLTDGIPDPDKSIPLHHVDYFSQLLNGIGLKVDSKPAYQYYLTEADHVGANKHLGAIAQKAYVSFHLGANWIPKRWPVEHFATLAKIIYEKWGLPIVVTGSANDQKLADEFVEKTPGIKSLILIAKTSLGEAGAIFKDALFVVSGDSGPMHIASGVGAKLIALFGPTDPVRTGPRGIGESVILSHVPEGFSAPYYGKEMPDWIAHILPEDVIKAVVQKKWVPSVSKAMPVA